MRKKLNININKQPKFFPPADPHKAALFAIATIKNGLSLDFGKSVLTKLWSEEQDISSDSTLETISKELGLSFADLKKMQTMRPLRASIYQILKRLLAKVCLEPLHSS